MSRINIEIPESDHQKLKIVSAIHSVSIKDFVLEAIRDKIMSQLSKIPNEDTLKAFSETDTGVGLTKHTNLEDLFKDLGLTNRD